MAADKLRVLVVEDDSIMGMEMEELLKGFGHEVLEVVSSAEDAIRIAQTGRPDIILMDVGLTGPRSGIDAARTMRSFISAPIIFITGYKDIATTNMVSSVDNSFHVTKPFGPMQLENAIRKAIDGKSKP